MLTVSTRHDDRARQVALAVQRSTGIETVLLFGSRARGDYGPDSDIDLLVVHPEDPGVFNACRREARRASARLYGEDIPTDLVVMSPAEFATMQFGLNHVAAKAARDGVTPMGFNYQPPAGGGAPPSSLHRRESMERALHSRLQFTQMQILQRGLRTFQPGERDIEDPVELDVMFGRAAQGALEHGLKAVLAAHGVEYQRIHDLVILEGDVARTDPDYRGLASPLAELSLFAGGDIYGTPQLTLPLPDLFERVRTDMDHLFALVEAQGGFDPWKVRKDDFTA